MNVSDRYSCDVYIDEDEDVVNNYIQNSQIPLFLHTNDETCCGIAISRCLFSLDKVLKELSHTYKNTVCSKNQHRIIHSLTNVESESMEMNFVLEEKELVQKYLPLTTTISHLGYLINEQVNKIVIVQTLLTVPVTKASLSISTHSLR